MDLGMNIKPLSLKSTIEVFSAAAVMLSLIFVGFEINESTRATRSSTAAETTATIADWYTSLGNDQQVSSVLRKFLSDPGSLTIEEQYQAAMRVHALMLILQSSFYLEDEGTLSPHIRRSMTKAILANPGMQFYWEQRKAIFVNEDFVAFVDQTLSGENTHSEYFYKPQLEQ